MATFEEIIKEIKSKVSITDVVEKYVDLKGNKASCPFPFHQDDTPSFFIYPETDTWRCYGCSISGDQFEFIQKYKNVSFVDARNELAEIARIDVSSLNFTNKSHDKSSKIISDDLNKNFSKKITKNSRKLFLSLYEVNEIASKYFKNSLISDSGKEVQKYLENRGIDTETSIKHGIGYAPNTMNTLVTYLKNQKNDPKAVKDVGLVTKYADGTWGDFFTGRLTIEIRNQDGEIIGFGGRKLDDKNKKSPKYINTRETDIFVKSSSLYGIDLAIKSIIKTSQIIIVEGYMDVIAAHQNGFTNVVACMGTAISKKQMEYIFDIFSNKKKSEIILCLDSDDAGIQATKRNLESVIDNFPFMEDKKDSIVVSVANLSGKDPDEVIRSDLTKWESSIKNTIPLLDYYIETLENINEKSLNNEVIKKSLFFIKNHVGFSSQDKYFQKLSELSGKSITELNSISDLKFSPQKNNSEYTGSSFVDSADLKNVIQETTLLSIILNEKDVKDFVTGIPLDHFSDDSNRLIYSLWLDDRLEEIYTIQNEDLVEKFDEIKNIRLDKGTLNQKMAIIDECKRRMARNYFIERKQILLETKRLNPNDSSNLKEEILMIDKKTSDLMKDNV